MVTIKLREIRKTDSDGLYSIYNDESSMRYFGRPDKNSQEEVKKMIEHQIAYYQQGVGVRYLAFDDEKFIGFVTLKRYEKRNLRAEIDYIITPEVRRQGYGTLMLQTFLRKVFAQWDIARITAYVNPENLPSQHLLEKVGFLYEGQLRNWDGPNADRYMYGFISENLERIE